MVIHLDVKQAVKRTKKIEGRSEHEVWVLTERLTYNRDSATDLKYTGVVEIGILLLAKESSFPNQ